MSEQPRTGGDPTHVGICTECGNPYPVQITDDDDVRPIGNSGECTCGSTDFRLASDE